MSNNNLTINEEKTGENSIKLTAKGQINSETVEMLKNKLDDAINNKNIYIIINMNGVSFLSSGGIRILLLYYKKMKSLKGKLFIQAPSESVKNVIGMVALNEMQYI